MKRSSAAASLISQLLAVLHAMQLCFLTYPAESFHFQHSSLNINTDLSDFKSVMEDSWYNGASPSATGTGVWLTPDPRDGRSSKESNLGRYVYKDPIQFMNRSSDFPKKVASFNTSFSFQIITSGDCGQDGSGMAFFISDSEKSPTNSDGGGLGLLDPDSPFTSNFFAVEFDTMQTFDSDKEPSGSHIGIDINSLQSLKVIDTSPRSSSGFFPQLYLYNNDTFTAWIEYTSSSNLIQVWMTYSNLSSQRPHRPCLELSYDLSSVFQDSMYVGFSASNYMPRVSMEGHAIYSWSFSSEDLNISKPLNTLESPSTSIKPTSVTPKSPKHGNLQLAPLAVIVSTLLALGFLGIVFFCI